MFDGLYELSLSLLLEGVIHGLQRSGHFKNKVKIEYLQIQQIEIGRLLGCFEPNHTLQTGGTPPSLIQVHQTVRVHTATWPW